MCQHGETAKIIINDEPIVVDRCLAPLLQALNDAGIPTIESCCGHGENPPRIWFGFSEDMTFNFAALTIIGKNGKLCETFLPALCWPRNGKSPMKDDGYYRGREGTHEH